MMRQFGSVFSFFLFLIVFINCSVAGFASEIESPLSERIIRVRGDYNYPPFEYVNAKGLPEGFNIDILIAVAEAMGMEIAITLGPWEEVRNALEQGEIDLLMGMFNTRDRDRKVDFSIPHFISSYAVFVREGSSIDALGEIKNKTVLVQAADLGHDYVVENRLTDNILTKSNWEDTLKSLSQGQGDCAIVLRLQGIHLINRLNISNIKAVGPPIIQREYCIAVAEGNSSLLAKVNEGLGIIKNNGTYDAVYEKWFGVFDEPRTVEPVVVKYLDWILFPIAGVACIGFLWSWLLKQQVTGKTKELCTELSERKRLEKQLRQAQKMEAIGTLAGGIAHDFNNILSAIVGYTELAIMHAKENKNNERCLEQVLKASGRAKELVGQILTFSRQRESERKPVMVKAIVKEALKLIRATLPSFIDIRQKIESDAMVMGDPTQIHQIIINLCANAGHAMDEKGGVLDVTLRKDVFDEEALQRIFPTLKPGSYLHLVVSDEGNGIASDVQDHIFEPFFTTKASGEGTGMGLAVVHGIVTHLEGAIFVESQPGRGAQFHVLLPVTDNSEKNQKKKTRDVGMRSGRILFVDDEPSLAESGQLLLKSLGYHVVSKTSSLEALALFKAEPNAFDLVFTDLRMPAMSGDQLAELMISIRPDIPVIICTGFNAHMELDALRQKGVQDILFKPVFRADFASSIKMVLDGETD